jgi:hypothetical protein
MTRIDELLDAFELGYIAHEKGQNLEKAMNEFKKRLNLIRN